MPGASSWKWNRAQFFADFAVIALLRFFQRGTGNLQRFFITPGCAVNTLQHFIIRIAAPVRAGH
jgi:hypothetical protein